MICTTCNVDVPKIDTGRINTASRSIYYVDDKGHPWRGKKCPVCVSQYRREWARKNRSDKPVKKREALGPDTVDNRSHRKCQRCKGVMSKARYFYCEGCQPELFSDPGEFLYS